MKVVYILAGGGVIAGAVATIIAIKKAKNTEKRLNDKINDLAGVVKSMKKERIDDWFESASDILTSHQESIDDLELKVNPAFFIYNEQKAINTIHDFADRIERLENSIDKLEDKAEEDSDEGNN